MKRVFVDTNVFLRFLTRDDPEHHRQAADLFGAAATGAVELWTGPPVLFELAWTLRRAFRKSREDSLRILEGVLACEGLSLTDGKTAEEALRLAAAHGMEFADAYVAASALRLDALATFNAKDFRKSGAVLHDFGSFPAPNVHEAPGRYGGNKKRRRGAE